MILSYKHLLYPTLTQAAMMTDMLGDFCDFYNAGLQQRVEAWYRRRVNLNFFAQAAEITQVRQDKNGLGRWAHATLAQVLRRLDKTYKAFFRRIQNGKKPGFPRFKSKSRYHSADFIVGNGLSLSKSGKLRIFGIPGEIKVKWHRALPSKPKTAILTRQNNKWYIIFHVEVETSQQPHEGGTVGLDLGLSSLIATSDGEIIKRSNWRKKAAKGLKKRQRALARCKKGSKRRQKAKARLAKYQAKTAARRRDEHHKLSHYLTTKYSGIGIEDLNIKGLSRSILSREVLDAAWAQLIAMITYKAERAGGQVIKVDPRGTSQTCPECGTVAPKTLKIRIHKCDCGCELDRDVAAAMVVHSRAFGHGSCHRTPNQLVAV